MHRRFLKSLATVMGAAALIVAPMAVSAQAADLVPDGSVAHVPGPPPTGTNHVEFWEAWLATEAGGDIDNATCTKEEDPDDPYTIPAAPAGTKYVLVVVKGGADDSANEYFIDPVAGETISHSTAGNSHVILCTVPHVTTTPPMTTPPSSTPPVVDTDRVSTGSGAGLGLYGAAAALLVGAGAIVIGRRRQGAHR